MFTIDLCCVTVSGPDDSVQILFVKNLTVEDESTFRCQVTGPDGPKNLEFELTVNGA